MKRHAFTLIELLIVVLIIAILAAIAVPNFLEFQTRAKVSRAKSDMRSLATAIEGYYVDFDAYPLCNTYALSGSCSVAGCSGLDALPVLERISTPIAYMTTGVLPDPFLSKFFTGSVYIGDEGDGGGMPALGQNYTLESNDPAAKAFIYQSVSSDRRAQFTATSLGTDRKPIGWVLGSVGPDLIRINLGGILENNSISTDARGFETKFRYCLNLQYDPTNGTVSWGEVYRAGGAINRDYGSVFLQAAERSK